MLSSIIEPPSEGEAAAVHQASLIIDDAWNELQRSPYVQSKLGVALARLPDLSFEEVQRRSRVGNALLKRCDALDHGTLPHDLALTLGLVRFRARAWAREADWYWCVLDPCGIGLFGLFLPTAYCGGFLLNIVHRQLASCSFAESDDTDRYLALIAGYARLIDQFTERTAGQAARGIWMPKAQVHQARALLARFKSGLHDALGVIPQRIATLRTPSFAREVENRVARCVKPAFDRAVENLSDAYLTHAPDTVGLGQYAGGADLYAELVRLHTTLDLTPEQVHARGHARITEIEMQMHAIRTELGFKGGGAAFLAHLDRDIRWRADTGERVTAVFQRYIDRLKPRFNEYFSAAPRAPFGVAPLPEALQGSMTYGYYDPPKSEHAEGRYLFNPAYLTKQALFHVASLTYHELMPGHHLHLATQHENAALHPFRRYSYVNAYNEGWAEYAATLAGEIGLYEQPEERYGRLMQDAFLTCRLVVDTGMNALGWSLERARTYMREHGAMPEAEVLTESLRYSCDIPGQALAYKLGDTQILALRERMQRALGARFVLKDFHAAILGPGALPLSDLEWHIEREIRRLTESRAQ